ncbi:MAG: hypothetical protein AAF487_08735 [Bacteroidota bacterium]
MNNRLKNIFIILAFQYCENRTLLEEKWSEIEKAYSESDRYYHNLQHLEHMFLEFELIQEKVCNKDVMLFALFYHDLIYDAKRQDNEEASAIKAMECLTQMLIPKKIKETCSSYILATKSHAISDNEELNIFLDLDLSVFGEDWERYKTFSENIRKEYAYYNDVLYNQGRIKVLTHFLTKESIFKTEKFKDRLEEQARSNMERELQDLSN